MKLFQNIQRYYKVLGVDPLQLEQPHRFKSASLLPLFSIAIYSVFAFVYLVFRAESFEESVRSYYLFSTAVAAFLSLLSILIRMEKLFDLIEKVETFIQKRLRYAESKLTYGKANAKIEKWSEIFYNVNVKVILPTLLLPDFIKSYFIYFTTDLGSDAFHMPFTVWFPFDWRNPFGFLVGYSMGTMSSIYIYRLVSCVMGFSFGVGFLMTKILNDVKNELVNLQIGNIKEGKLKAHEIKRTLVEFVDNYSNAREIVNSYEELYDIIITAIFLWSLTTICALLMLICMELRDGFSMFVVSLICLMLSSVGNILVICEIGHQISDHFDELNDAVYQINWHSFPHDVQRLLPTVLIATQDTFILSGFGNALCTRESFINVVNGAYSYLTVLWRFAK